MAEQTDKFIPGGLAVDAAGKTLFVCGTWGDAIVRVPIDNAGEHIRIPLTKTESGKKAREAYPYACVADKAGKRLFVSFWNRAAVGVIDLEKNSLTTEWATESHPTEMVLSPDGTRLFVACAEFDKGERVGYHQWCRPANH